MGRGRPRMDRRVNIGGDADDLRGAAMGPQDELMDIIENIDPAAQLLVYLYRTERTPGQKIASRVLVDQLDHVPEYPAIGTAYGGGRYEMMIYSLPDRKLIRRHVFSLDRRWDSIANESPAGAGAALPAVAPSDDSRQLMMVLVELVKALAAPRQESGKSEINAALAGIADVGSRMIEKTYAHNLTLLDRTMRQRMSGDADPDDPDAEQHTEGGNVVAMADRLSERMIDMLKMVIPLFTQASPEQQKALAEQARQRPDVRAALDDVRTRKRLVERVKAEFPADADRILEIFGLKRRAVREASQNQTAAAAG